MIRSISKTFDQLFQNVCTTIEVSVLYDPELDIVTKIVSIQVLKSTYKYQGNTRTFTGADLLADITPIVFDFFPAMLQEIRLMDCWKEVYKNSCELKAAEAADVGEIMSPYDTHTLAMNGL